MARFRAERWLLGDLVSGAADQRTAHHQDPGINSPLVLMHNGREVLVTGHVSCVKGDDYEIQATATQSTTGALARDRIEGRCSGRTEQYEAPTWVYDEALVAPGPAQVCGLLITRTGGKVSDVFQWCRKEDVDLRAGARLSISRGNVPLA